MAIAHQIGPMISDLNQAPVPHPQFLVAALLLPHLVLVQGLTAWRAAVVADVLTAEVAMVIVLMTGHLTVRLGWSLAYLQGVRTLPRTSEVIEVPESEHLPGTVIETGRAKETETLAGTDTVKGIATETERRSGIGTGRETGREKETRTRTKIVIVATETENVIGIATVIATVTAEMRKIVTGIRGKIARFPVVVLFPQQLLLPWTLVIYPLVLIPQGTVADHKSVMMHLARGGVLLMTRLTVIPRGAPVRKDIVKIVPVGQRRRVMIDLENPIGVGSEKHLNLNYATLYLNDLARSDYQRVPKIYLLVHLLHHARWHLGMRPGLNPIFLLAEVVGTGRVRVTMAHTRSQLPPAAG